MIHFENRDCVEAMKEFPDNFFDLAIVDPPYGDGSQTVNVEREREHTTDSAADSTSTRIPRGGWHGKQKYHLGTPTGEEQQTTGEHGVTRIGCGLARKYTKKIISWDVAPKQEYFSELFRISRNQIIWGGNYFSLPPTRCFLIWRKLTISEAFSMAMCEYAWTSFNSNAKWIEIAPQGDTNRFHPTQKPIKLYTWILENYAKQGDKILDTHVGSASSLIACDRMGFECWGYEIDETYYKLAQERIKRELAQGTLF
jgi:site-specific DNA-methyltransferase (adenine-specific)